MSKKSVEEKYSIRDKRQCLCFLYYAPNYIKYTKGPNLTLITILCNRIITLI